MTHSFFNSLLAFVLIAGLMVLILYGWFMCIVYIWNAHIINIIPVSRIDVYDALWIYLLVRMLTFTFRTDFKITHDK